MDVYMSAIDIIFVIFGSLLIIAGLYLFISNKKDASSNQVEGFGIKLNVSNPSIILILSGVGLLVLPRFMPEKSINQTPTVVTTQSETNQNNSQSVFFPENSWQLNSYQENGVDYSVPYQVNASINFSNRSNTQINWATQVFVLNMNGTIINNSYTGDIKYINNGYTISFISGTEPGFMQELNLPLDIKMENGGILHMRYRSSTGEQIVHWQR
jgi:hypothetical protein